MGADQVRTWVTAAQGGDAEALGRLLESFRPYLLAVADREWPGPLRVKCGGSDLVQETLLDAHRGFATFEGDGPGAVRAWLRRILRFNAAGWARRYRQSDKRAVGRERSLHADRQAGTSARGLVDREPTPGACAVAREEARILDAAIERLPDDERAVVLLRNRDHLPWDEVGRRLDRSPEAARKLWGRALDRLQGMLESLGGP
jgi:RNA polymerase sigma-70 factor (ECF subfamily)